MRKKRQGNYINNKEFLEELKGYLNNDVLGRIPDSLARYFLLLARHMASSYNFSGYSFKEDMIQQGVLFCIKYCKNFDTTRKNPFAYFSQIIYSAFIQEIKKEKKYFDFVDSLKEKEETNFNKIKQNGYFRFIEKFNKEEKEKREMEKQKRMCEIQKEELGLETGDLRNYFDKEQERKEKAFIDDYEMGEDIVCDSSIN